MANMARWLPSLPSVLRTPVIGCARPVTVLCSRNYGTRRESQPWKQRPNRKARLAIVLTQDVQNLGTRGQLVRVKHGYARNWLLPKKFAVYATPDNIKLYDAWETEKGLARGVNYADYLKDNVLEVEKEPKCAVNEQEISTAFRKRFQLHVPLDCVELEQPIASLGDHSVDVWLDESSVVTVPVHVVEKTPRIHKKKDIVEPQLDS